MAGIGALRQLIRGLEAEKRTLRDENLALKKQVATLQADAIAAKSEKYGPFKHAKVSDESPVQESSEYPPPPWSGSGEVG